ncbi:MAG: ATP-binding cassette domain-containing protein [Methanomicrobiales archaeon]|nr:ATP-binding cassette domain-containing protein [Methanomicrobiales archaeon]
MIEISALRHLILDIPLLRIPEGHCMVIGGNGAGKSTLLGLCAGMQVPLSGSVAIGGREPRSSQVGWVAEFPDRTLVFESVADEIASSLRFQHRSCAEIRREVDACAERMGISHLLSASTRELSGGERVLVALAAAIIARPLLLVLDDVDAHLDERSANAVQAAIAHSGTGHVVQSTQNMETAAAGDWIVCLEKGQVIHSGTPETVFDALAGSWLYPESWRG